MNDKRKKTNLYRFITIIFLFGFLCCVGILAHARLNRKNAQSKYNELLAQMTEAVSEEMSVQETEQQSENSIPDKQIDWEMLKEENADIYAWIYIPNTNIDYPILQHPTDDNYYLQHNLDGSTGYPGCIFTQSMNALDFTDSNTVIYGHNMGDGSMFHTLHEFEDNIFFDDNSYVYIYTPEGSYTYEIFASCEFSDAHLLHSYDFTSTNGYQSFLDDIRKSRGMSDHVRIGTGVDTDSHIITLSTCIKNSPDKRYLVSAVLIE